MLILTRRAGETVMIGSDVTITVLGVKGNQVRIGINAPRDVAVHREEIYERIQNEKNAKEADASAEGCEILFSPLPRVFPSVRCSSAMASQPWHRDIAAYRRDG